eukprot:6485881-Amphidinium_carterae.1
MCRSASARVKESTLCIASYARTARALPKNGTMQGVVPLPIVTGNCVRMQSCTSIRPCSMLR